MKIAVCDDNERERGQLGAFLQQELDARCVDGEIVSYESGDALLEALRGTSYPVYFLDIYMKGTSGVEVARRIRAATRQAAIVFATSSPDHRAEGFDVGAAHYLVKPFTRADVGEALERCLKLVGAAGRYVEVVVNRKPRRVLLSSILSVESQDKYCVLHTQQGPVRTLGRLDELEALLNDERFLRCHRSYLVNMDHVLGDIADGCFTLRDGRRVPIRREDRACVQARFEDYCFHKTRRRP